MAVSIAVRVRLLALILLAGPWLATPLAAQSEFADGLARLFSESVREADQRLLEIGVELAKLPELRQAQQSPRLGFHSQHLAEEGDPHHVQIDLGAIYSIDRIVLVPAVVILPGVSGDGYGFPLRYKVEIGSDGYKVTTSSGSTTTATIHERYESAAYDRNIHTAAARGDLRRVKKLVEKNPSLLTQEDNNGWLALHEAARGGQTRVVEYLVSRMDDESINHRTNDGNGASPLWWAKHMLDEDHSTIKALERAGAKDLAPLVK